MGVPGVLERVVNEGYRRSEFQPTDLSLQLPGGIDEGVGNGTHVFLPLVVGRVRLCPTHIESSPRTKGTGTWIWRSFWSAPQSGALDRSLAVRGHVPGHVHAF